MPSVRTVALRLLKHNNDHIYRVLFYASHSAKRFPYWTLIGPSSDKDPMDMNVFCFANGDAELLINDEAGI